MIYYKKKIQQDVGATAVEYGILSALIAVITILGLQATGTSLGTTYCTIANQLSKAVGAGATASGCSATSSPSNGTGTGAGPSAKTSAKTSANGSGSSPASKTPDTTWNASKNYSLGDNDNVKNFFAEVSNFGITNMSGFYDSNGKEITTPSQLAGLFGTKAAQDFGTEMNTYQAYTHNNNFNNLMANSNATTAFNTDIDNYYSSHSGYSPMFFSDPSSVSFSGSYPWGNRPYTTTYSATGIDGNPYITGLSGSASNINFNYNAPTGKAN